MTFCGGLLLKVLYECKVCPWMINILLPSKFSTLRIFIETTQNKFERTTEVESFTTTRVSKLFPTTNISLWIFLKLLTISPFLYPTCLCVLFFSPKTIPRWTVVSMAKRNFATHERFTFRILFLRHTHILTILLNILHFIHFIEPCDWERERERLYFLPKLRVCMFMMQKIPFQAIKLLWEIIRIVNLSIALIQILLSFSKLIEW